MSLTASFSDLMKELRVCSSQQDQMKDVFSVWNLFFLIMFIYHSDNITHIFTDIKKPQVRLSAWECISFGVSEAASNYY